jgi:hypothetical protein
LVDDDPPRNKYIWELVREEANLGAADESAEVDRLAGIAQARGLEFNFKYLKYVYDRVRGSWTKKKRQKNVRANVSAKFAQATAQGKKNQELVSQLDEINQILQQRHDLSEGPEEKKKNSDD